MNQDLKLKIQQQIDDVMKDITDLENSSKNMIQTESYLKYYTSKHNALKTRLKNLVEIMSEISKS